MSQENDVSHTALAPEQNETDVLDAEWRAAPSRRSRFRVGALVVLVVLLVFLGGVEVQKRWGHTDTSSTGGPTRGSFPTGGSFPAGGFSGLSTGGTGTRTGGSTSNTSSASTPAVIGKLVHVSGHTWTVKDLGGHSHTVEVTAKTTVTRSLAQATGPIRTGTSITVLGKTHGDTVAATAVTIR